MVKLSVVVPVYNVAPYLQDCLDSVWAAAAKSDVKVELIAVDDGSTDGSTEFLRSYSSVHASLRVFYQQNAGVSVARNVGLEAASGDWVYFLDGDDVLSPFACVWLANCLRCSDGIDMIVSSMSKYQDGEQPRFGEPHGMPSTFDLTAAVPLAVLNETSLMGGVFFRRKVIGNIRFVPGMTMGEDRLFNLHCLMQCNRIVVSPAEVSAYRQRVSSVNHSQVWNADRLARELVFRRQALALKAKTAKEFPIEHVWWIELDFPFHMPEKIVRMDKTERARAIDLWLENATYFASFPSLPRLKRRLFWAAMRICGICRKRILFWVLIVWPQQLLKLSYAR